MKTSFPKNDKKYSQINRSNILGNIWSSFNLDLQTNLGALRVAPRLLISTTATGLPVAAKYYDKRIMAICGTKVFIGGEASPSQNFAEDTSVGAQTDYNIDESDMQLFGSILVTTTTDGLFSKTDSGSGGGAWTQRDTLSTGSPHMITYFKKFDRAYYTNLVSGIRSISKAWVVAGAPSDYAIQLDDSDANYITCLKSASQNIWIGIVSTGNAQKGGHGRVYIWDGISAQVTAQYILEDAQGVLSMVIDPEHDVPYIMDTNGVLSVFNGTGFTEVARLPYGSGQTMPWGADDPDNSERFIHPNGMIFTKNGTIRMLINNRTILTANGTIENLPSGIWEWSKETGLVHMAAPTYNSGFSITDFGQNQVSLVGCLASIQIPPAFNIPIINGVLIAGVQYFTNATATETAIFYDDTNDTIQKKGYFVTTWIESPEIASAWDDIWMSYRQFLSATDNITVKYRNTEANSTFGTITWVNTTSFTILNADVNVGNYWTANTGGEVEILRGTGSGACVHITNAVNNAGTWTVTIDEAVTGVTTGTAVARFQNWIKVFPQESLSQVSSWNKWTANTDSTPRMQVKVCFTFTGPDEFYKAIITSNEDITTT